MNVYEKIKKMVYIPKKKKKKKKKKNSGPKYHYDTIIALVIYDVTDILMSWTYLIFFIIFVIVIKMLKTREKLLPLKGFWWVKGYFVLGQILMAATTLSSVPILQNPTLI